MLVDVDDYRRQSSSRPPTPTGRSIIVVRWRGKKKQSRLEGEAWRRQEAFLLLLLLLLTCISKAVFRVGVLFFFYVSFFPENLSIAQRNEFERYSFFQPTSNCYQQQQHIRLDEEGARHKNVRRFSPRLAFVKCIERASSVTRRACVSE